MKELEAKQTKLKMDLDTAPTPQPILHPNLSNFYRTKVADLAGALSSPEARTEAHEALRGLIEGIVLTPCEGGYSIDLRGDLAGILALASDKRAKIAGADVAEAVSQIFLVAGVGFEPTTFRL